MGKSKLRDPDDPFGENRPQETRAEARQRMQQAKRAAATRRDDADSKGGVRWGAVAMLAIILLSGLMPFLANLTDSLAALGLFSFAASSGVAPDGAGRHSEWLSAFYRKHNPTKMGDVPGLLAKYKGREDALFRKLGEKYGERP